MTRDQFIERVDDFYKLLDFCYERNLDSCDSVKDSDDFDDYINECLYDWIRYDSWQEVRNALDDIPEGYQFYDIEYGFDGLTNRDFPEYKQKVLDEADEKDIWSEEDEYDEPEIDFTDVDDNVDGEELLEQFVMLSA